ncbi:MAG: cation:proton antiporter [Proteobacteria bacterium]|nr:cation:proton antiporter [Pseudomonadota bacterium]
MHSFDWAVDIIIVIGFVTFTSTLLSYMRVPSIVGFIISGLLISHFGLVKDLPGITTINEIGLALLMFTVGLEFSSDKIRYLSKSLVGLGIAMMVVVIAGTTLMGWGLGLWSFSSALMIGMVVSLSSSAIVLKILQKRRELETPHGNASVGVLLAQDMLFAPMIMSIPFIFGSISGDAPAGSYQSLTTLALFGAYCVALVVFTRYLLNPLFNLVLKTGSHELFFFLLFFLFSAISFSTESLVGSISLGAFMAGLCFANSPLSKQALSDILPLRDTFLGLLFASVGMLVDLDYFIKHFAAVLLGGVLILFIKPTVIYILARMQHYSHSVSMMTGLLTFQVGEFSIVLIKELNKRKHFTNEETQYFLCLIVLSMALTPFIHKITPWIVERTRFLNRIPFFAKNSQHAVSEKHGLEDRELKDHTIIVGYGVAGKKLGSVLDALDISYLALEMNFSTVLKAQKESLPVMFGDAQRQEILHVAGIEKARCMVITIPAVGVSRMVMFAARQLVPTIPVIIRVEYERGLDLLHGLGGMETVVAEHESTLQILAKTLATYEVNHHTIMSHLNRIKSSWHTPSVVTSKSEKGRALVSAFIPYHASEEQQKQEHRHDEHIHHHTLSETSYATDLTFKELGLLQSPHAHLVSMRKNHQEQPFMPTNDYVFVSGDTLTFYGSTDYFDKIVDYLENGDY